MPKSFKAVLERMQSRLNWVIIRIPFDVAKVWGVRGQLKVKGEINSFAFRTSLFPARTGGHILLVNKRMQAGAGTGPGDTARFHLEPDTEERVASVPEELEPVLSEDPALQRWFDGLNYSTLRDISHWITDVKSPEARQRRADQMAERLLAVMEAEQELPPALRLAFAQDVLAQEGWKRMSPAQRRGQLFAIFYYRTPDARARRLAKVIQAAHELARKLKSPRKE
ncbi:MAG: YdeI/OmpD-associated family protein [Bryobacteraceae bacterium]|jgi:hypothetical protein